MLVTHSQLPYQRTQLAFLSFAIGIAASLASRRHVSKVYFAVAGVVAGLLTLVKTIDGIEGAAVFYVLLAMSAMIGYSDQKLSWRQLSLLALTPPLSFILGYALVERGISHFWSYLMTSLHIAMGYSEAMAFPGPDEQVTAAVSVLWPCVF